MHTATLHKGVDEEGCQPVCRAVEQMAGLNEAARKIENKFTQFAEQKRERPRYDDVVLENGTATSITATPVPAPEYVPYARLKVALSNVALGFVLTQAFILAVMLGIWLEPMVWWWRR